jgi:AcrR family transcriptional regulator
MSSKDKIFVVALDLFAEKGFDAVSVRDIMAGAGLAVGSFYNHFKGKNELLQEIYDHYRSLFIRADGAEPDYTELLEKYGPVGLFAHITDSFIVSMNNDKLRKLSKIIVMEQYKNETAGRIAYEDRQKLLREMEGIFRLMGEKGYVKSGNPALMGRLVGYVFLGFASDNFYCHAVKSESPEAIAARQNEAMRLLITELLKV